MPHVAVATADHYSGVFSRPGALVRTPGGNVEDVARYKTAGLSWLLLNAEHADWYTVRMRCAQQQIPCGLWLHCRTVDQLRDLIYRNAAAHSIVGVNVEAELRTTLTPAVIRRLIDESGYQGEVAVITYGWIQNDVDMAPLADLPVMLECFPADDPNLWDEETRTVKWADCETHARQLGVQHPMLLMQAYRRQPLGWGRPSWYPAVSPRHVYTLDDATGENGPIEDWLP